MLMKIVIKPPYNFELSLGFLTKDENHPSPEFKNDGNLWRIFRINDKSIPVKISSIGTVENPALKISTTEISQKGKSELKKKAEQYLNFNEDLSELYAFMNKNEKLREIKKELYGFKAPTMGTTIYEMIIKAIIQQQIAGRIAFYMASKIVRKFGECIIFEGEEYYGFPSSETFAKLSISDLRGCSVSERKAEYIINFSKEIANHRFDPEMVREWSLEKIVEQLTAFRGIGKWTAELIAASIGKGRGPADDLGLKKAFSEFNFDENLQENRELISIPRSLSVYMVYAHRRRILKSVKGVMEK